MGTIDYYRSGEIVEIIIRDFSGAKIDTFVCPIKDKKKLRYIMRLLKEKYGFEPEVDEGFNFWK